MALTDVAPVIPTSFTASPKECGTAARATCRDRAARRVPARRTAPPALRSACLHIVSIERYAPPGQLVHTIAP